MTESILNNQPNEPKQHHTILRRRVKATNTPVEEFKQAMQNAGVEPPAEIIADSAIHRFAVAGDRPQSNNGWYVLYADNLAAGAFGCWKRGISKTWSGKPYEIMTSEEKVVYDAKIDAAKRQREEEQKRIWQECRAWCTEKWNKAKDASNKNPYLKRKNVNSYGLKAYKDTLLITVQDIKGTIHGLQFIYPDGSKKFKTGTSKTGHFFKIGKSKDKTVIACEGYATGASIHQATGHAVVIAFDAGNLLPVAKSIRSKYPDMKIIIAADDDHVTEGNPGLTKATVAALAVNGLLAIPTFPDDRGQKDTDFNDLSQLAGPQAVKACIESAALPPSAPTIGSSSQSEVVSTISPFDAVIKRLAALSPLLYDQVRKSEAKALGVQLANLDAAVKDARNGSVNENLPFIKTEPWPEPVDPSTLLTDIAATIRRFIVCNEEVAHTVALWVAMTWFIDVVNVAPFAIITAPEKRCGKSLLLTLLGKLSARAITASNITPAALFRAIEAWAPTLLIDEADSFMKGNEDMRGILDGGHMRDGAFVIRTVGENFTPTKFSTWGAKALASIGHVADTLMDRAVVLELRRKLPHENVERIRHAEPNQFGELRSKLARFAEDFSEDIRHARPSLPNSLNDRAQDNWEPLLAIAMTASDEWFKKGTSAALKLSDVESASQTIGTELLSDIQKIFKDKNVDRIATADLLSTLCADDERPWQTYSKGFPITPRQLANKLKAYTIHSKTIRIGDVTAKGYEKDNFTEVFSRYIPSQSSASVTASQSNLVEDLPAFPSVTIEVDVTDRNQREPKPVGDCDVVTDEKVVPPAQPLMVLVKNEDLREGIV